MREPPASDRLHVAERGGDAALLDGSTIHLQPLTTDDRVGLVEFFASLSPQSSRFRFLGTVGRLKGPLLDRLLDLDPERAFAYVATRGGEIVATASAHRELNSDAQSPLACSASAEVAFAVRDDLQNLGVGMLLLELLASHARRVGITSFTAMTASDNDAMIGVFRSAGFDASIHRDPHDATTVMVEFSIDDDAASSDARWRREQRAVAASLQPLLRPQSIAVVGASRDSHSVGRRLLQELVGNGFKGGVFPVNPKATVIDGLPVVASVADISEPIDLAVIAVPSAAVIGVVEDCARRGVRAVLVLSAGFAETGPEGAERQRELLRVTRAGGMRLVGPNCLGIVTADASVSMHAVFTPLADVDAWPEAWPDRAGDGGAGRGDARRHHERSILRAVGRRGVGWSHGRTVA